MVLDYYRNLIEDKKRTLAYHRALEQTIKPGDVVIDLGTGIGILALMACRLGARHVYAIEETAIAAAAELIVREQGLSDRITVLTGNSRSVTLPEPADLLVTETLGMLGFDEGILGNVIDARSRLLRAGATIIPQRVALMIAPIQDTVAYTAHVDWWNAPQFGVDFSFLRPFASNTIRPHGTETELFIDTPAVALDAELATTPAFITGGTTFTASCDATLHGFAAWFDATLAPSVNLTNAPDSGTMWSHAFLALREPVALREGDAIEVEVACNDGKLWKWSGSAAAHRFNQSTAFATPRTLTR